MRQGSFPAHGRLSSAAGLLAHLLHARIGELSQRPARARVGERRRRPAPARAGGTHQRGRRSSPEAACTGELARGPDGVRHGKCTASVDAASIILKKLYSIILKI